MICGAGVERAASARGTTTTARVAAAERATAERRRPDQACARTQPHSWCLGCRGPPRPRAPSSVWDGRGDHLRRLPRSGVTAAATDGRTAAGRGRDSPLRRLNNPFLSLSSPLLSTTHTTHTHTRTHTPVSQDNQKTPPRSRCCCPLLPPDSVPVDDPHSSLFPLAPWRSAPRAPGPRA